MVGHSGWYPPSQVCSPPELPTYLKEVFDLKPIVGLASDEEVIGIHSVIHAANRVSVVPGMHNPILLMGLADHLFSVQMAKYRSKYSLITFPSDATYTPPTLPAHVSVNLELVSSAPTDNEIMKVQDAVQTYQEMRRFPSMFDTHVNMELSQHLFDLQMARHMRLAGESQPCPVSQNIDLPRIAEQTAYLDEEFISATNNAGTGANITNAHQPPPELPGISVQGLMEQSNRLTERFNQLLERSNELAERSHSPADQPDQLAERFNQILERFTQVAERIHEPTQQSDRFVEHFNLLFERFNALTEQSNQLAQQSDRQSHQLLERSNRLAEQLSLPIQQSNLLSERFNKLFERSSQLLSQIIQPLQRSNELAEQLNRSTKRSSMLMEVSNKPIERLESTLKNINRVFVGIQHAIVRNHTSNKLEALNCLVNEAGVTPGVSETTLWTSFDRVAHQRVALPRDIIHFRINGSYEMLNIPPDRLGRFLRFYGIGGGLWDDEASCRLITGKLDVARKRLGTYLSSCLG